MKFESSSLNSKKKSKKLRSIKLSRMPTSNPSTNRVKTRFHEAPVDSVIDDASSEPTQVEYSTTSADHLKETSNSQASIHDSESSFDRNNSQESESDSWKPNIVSFQYANRPLGNSRKVLSLKSNTPLKKKSSSVAPFPNFGYHVKEDQEGNQSDRASVSSSSNGLASSSTEESGKRVETEIPETMKPDRNFTKSRFDHQPPNYLKVTSTSEGKKMHFQASLHDSESSNEGTDESRRNSNKSKPNYGISGLKRTPSLRPLRILMSKSSFKSKKHSVKKCSHQISEASSVNKATCSSTLKDSKFPHQVEERESIRTSSTKVCPYNYCSLHGHHHSSTPPLKRVLSKRRHLLKTQKSLKVKRQSSVRGKYSGDIMELIETSQTIINIGKQENSDTSVEIYTTRRTEFFRRSSEGNENGNLAEIILGETSHPEKGFQESLNKDRDFVTGEQESSNSTTDEVHKSHLHKRNHTSLWNLIHQHMLSEGGENRILEGKNEEKQWDETNRDSYQNTSVENHDRDDQEIEIRKMYATKVVREAIEKILLPEVEDQSSDDQSISSNFASEQEILDNNLGEGGNLSISNLITKNEKEKADKKKPNSWSNLKKLILLERFIKALEKVRKYNPCKPQHLPLEHTPRGGKILLKPQMIDRKRSSEEWMLDYALQQVVSELAPTQKRKVELLIKAFETMAPPSDEEQVQVPVDGKQDDSASWGQTTQVDGLSGETALPPLTESQTAEGNDKITPSATDNDSFKQLAIVGEVTNEDSDPLELLTTMQKQKSSLTDFCKEDDPESNREKLGVDDLISATKITTSDDSAEAAAENIVISSACGCGPMEELNQVEERKKADPELENEFIQELHQVNDSEPNHSSHDAYKTDFEKEKHGSMWQLIHQRMVEGLSGEGQTKNLHNENEEHERETNTLAATENTDSCPDICASDKITGMEYHDTQSEEVELRKMFAIKLVREAIEKILLPEIQDQSSDDQSVTSEITSDQELIEKSHSESGEPRKSSSVDSAKHCSLVSNSNTFTDNVSFSREGKNIATTNISESKNEKTTSKAQSEKKTPKGWTNLKKLILLRRFIKELEKVRKFKPEKPRLLPLKPGVEAEQVSLRHQLMNARKSTEEWMLDYALRKVVSELAPKQKRKVALLVKAFETVAPTSGTPQIQVAGDKGDQEAVHDSPSFRLKLLKDGSKSMGRNIKLDDFEGVDVDLSSVPKNTAPDGSKETTATYNMPSSASASEPFAELVINTEEKKKGHPETDCTTTVASNFQMDKQKHISMWHLLCQHVVSDIAAKVESQLPDEEDEDEQVDGKTFLQMRNGSFHNEDSSSQRIGFSQRDAVKLVREAIDEILSPEVQDDSSDAQSVASDIVTEQELQETNHADVGESSIVTSVDSPKDGREYAKREEKDHEIIRREKRELAATPDKQRRVSMVGNKTDQGKLKNWSTLKKLILLKRSIKALEKARNPNLRATQSLRVKLSKEEEKVDLRHQSIEEKKKAEKWMLDYAVQHIVTKLTPARKRRVSMLVEAFEAMVPLPEV